MRISSASDLFMCVCIQIAPLGKQRGRRTRIAAYSSLTKRSLVTTRSVQCTLKSGSPCRSPESHPRVAERRPCRLRGARWRFHSSLSSALPLLCFCSAPRLSAPPPLSLCPHVQHFSGRGRAALMGRIPRRDSNSQSA